MLSVAVFILLILELIMNLFFSLQLCVRVLDTATVTGLPWNLAAT